MESGGDEKREADDLPEKRMSTDQKMIRDLISDLGHIEVGPRHHFKGVIIFEV